MEISIRHVTKRFPGGVVALDGVSLTIGRGMYGLLGPNGAGKTTLMRILATLMTPDRGTVTVGDIDLAADPQAVRLLLGYLPQEVGFYRQLSAAEYMELVAGMKGLSAAEGRRQSADLLERVNLERYPKIRIGKYSGGMKRRLGIAQALLGDPQILIVDEPTAGLDPEERIRFRNLLADLSGERIVLLSTHIVADVESVCSNLAVLNQGKLVYSGGADALREFARGRTWQVELPAGEYERWRHTLQVVASRRAADTVHLRVVAEENPLDAGAPDEPTLEDGYLCLMAGRKSRRSEVPA